MVDITGIGGGVWRPLEMALISGRRVDVGDKYSNPSTPRSFLLKSILHETYHIRTGSKTPIYVDINTTRTSPSKKTIPTNT